MTATSGSISENALDLQALAVLREVARRGSFGQAAKALAYTQPAVSQRIAALEREYDVRLFERSPRGASLTPAGRLQKALGMLEQ